MLLKKQLKEAKAKGLKPEILKKVIFVFLLCSLISTLLFVFMVEVDGFVCRSDFVSFINGAYILGSGKGVDLYDLQVQYENQQIVTKPYNQMSLLPYRNPPIVALLFIPFTLLPLVVAYKLFTLLLILTILLIVWLSNSLFNNLKNSFWLMLPIIFYPSIIAIFAGQVSIFILLIYFAGYYYFKKKKPFLLGLITGFLLLKPQYFISIPFIFLVISKKKNFLRGLLVTCLLIYLISILIVGPGFLKVYFQMLVETEDMVAVANTSMFTLFYTLSKTAIQKHLAFLVNLILYFVTLYYFYANYRKINLERNYCLIVLSTLVFCVHGVIVDMAITLLPILILLDGIKSKREFVSGDVVVLFILVLSPLGYTLKVPYIISLLFLLSVALLFRKSKIQISYR
jgi:hypothetical protein